MTQQTLKWFQRGTAIIALTAFGTAGIAQTVIVGTDDPSVTTNGNDVQSGAEVGGIENTATLTGDYVSNGTTTSYQVQAFENVDVADAVPNLDLTKVATSTGSLTAAVAGDVLTYTYTVTNNGNVTMTTLALTDVHNNAATATGDLSAIVCDTITQGAVAGTTTTDTVLPATNDNSIISLGVGDSVTCTASYTVEQADVDTLQNQP